MNIENEFQKEVLNLRRQENSDIMGFYADEPIWIWTESAIHILNENIDDTIRFLTQAEYDVLECVSELLEPIAYYMKEDKFNKIVEALDSRLQDFPDTEFECLIKERDSYINMIKHYPESICYVELNKYTK